MDCMVCLSHILSVQSAAYYCCSADNDCYTVTV